jgi:hypothetical protein
LSSADFFFGRLLTVRFRDLRDRGVLHRDGIEPGTANNCADLGLGLNDGIGDGHVASLFPGHPALDDARGVVPVTDSPKPPPHRVSMSVVRLRGAHHRLVAAIGGAKHGAVERLRAGERGPSVLIEPTRWYLDEAASHDGAAR